MTELVKNDLTNKRKSRMKQEELATKRWINAVNNDDTVYETFKLILSDELTKRIPAFKNNHKFILVSVTGSHNYGTAHEGSDVDLRVVYTESLRVNLSIDKPTRLNFHIQTELNFYDDIIPLDIQFIHISTFLKQLSKSSYTALEALTSNYTFYSWFEDREIKEILEYYNLDVVRSNAVSIIRNNKANETKSPVNRKIRDHLLLLSALDKPALLLLLEHYRFWDAQWGMNITEAQFDELLNFKVDSVKLPEEYVSLLNSYYFRIFGIR